MSEYIILMRRFIIEYRADDTNPDEVRMKLADCLSYEAVEKLANDYCPSGVHAVVRGG